MIATSKRGHTQVALVTGAGFGPAATETLVLRLVGRMATAPARVRVAAAAEVTRHSDGVRQTIQESISQGAITYRDGQVVREALGSRRHGLDLRRRPAADAARAGR